MADDAAQRDREGRDLDLYAVAVRIHATQASAGVVVSADWVSLLAKFRRAEPGASLESIHTAAERLATTFPTDYVTFMRESNGGEGEIGTEGYLQLWPIETLVELNEAYKTAECFPGFVFLGSNGGGEAIALRCGPDGCELFLVPFIGSSSDALFGGRSLIEFLRSHGTGQIWERKRR